MDIAVQILATSVPIRKENLRYKVKTWWAHVDVEEGQTTIPVPNLPMIQPFYDMNGRQTTVFVEMWYTNPDLFPVGAMRFLGLAKQRVDNQLRNPAWNPTVEWLEVYDPIEDISRGRLLLKIDAQFVPITSSPLVNRDGQGSRPVSSYFNNPVPESVDNSLNQDKNTDAKEHGSCQISFNSSMSPIPKGKGVSVQEKEFKFPRNLDDPDPALNSDSDSKTKASDKDKIDLDFEIAKAKLDLAVRERERNRKLLEQNGQPIQVSGRSRNNNNPDFWNLEMSPITSTTAAPRRCRYKHYKISASNYPGPPPPADPGTTTDSEVDDVINILNQNIRIDEAGVNRDTVRMKTLQSTPPEMDTRTKDLVTNVKKLEQLQVEIKNARPKQRLQSEGSAGSSAIRRIYPERDPAKRLATEGGGTRSADMPSRNAITKLLDEEDLTVYGCGFRTSKPSSNNTKGPKTSLNYAFIEEQRAHADPKSSNSQSDNYMKPSNSSRSPIPPISLKCAAKFDHKK